MAGRFSIPGGGMLTGLKVTFVTMIKTIFNPKVHLKTVNYPLVKEEPVARARGVIALDQEACTVCMLCARNCPDWCIYIEGHKEEKEPVRHRLRPLHVLRHLRRGLSVRCPLLES
jgi:NADH-quinone oxidoreductase subunit I